LGEEGVIEIFLAIGAILLVGWIIQTLVSTAKKSGSMESALEQARKAQEKLKDATDAGIASSNHSDTHDGLLEDDGNKRD
jgi:hypothetical protein